MYDSLSKQIYASSSNQDSSCIVNIKHGNGPNGVMYY